MKLKCVLRYANDPRNLRFKRDDVFEADEELLTFLKADAPGCFAEIKSRAKRVRKPPADKAVQEPPVEK